MLQLTCWYTWYCSVCLPSLLDGAATFQQSISCQRLFGEGALHRHTLFQLERRHYRGTALLSPFVWFVLLPCWVACVFARWRASTRTETLGISVRKTCYLCVIVSGVLGFKCASVTLAIISQFTRPLFLVSFFIALAAVICKWKPCGNVVSSMQLARFRFTQALAILLGGGATQSRQTVLPCSLPSPSLRWSSLLVIRCA